MVQSGSQVSPPSTDRSHRQSNVSASMPEKTIRFSTSGPSSISVTEKENPSVWGDPRNAQ
jgi:hypothetical protein